MTANYFWCTVLIITLSVTLVTPAHASGGGFGPIGYNGPVVGPILGAAAAVAAVIIVVVYYSKKKRSITGCVASAGGGMSLTDEKDKRVYMLSGDPVGVKPGDRMKLKGRKVKPTGPDKTLVWEATEVSKDFGVCQP